MNQRMHLLLQLQIAFLNTILSIFSFLFNGDAIYVKSLLDSCHQHVKEITEVKKKKKKKMISI
jgi:hypothetical protein